MQELEKILEEIGELRGQAGSECTSEDHYIKKAWEHCLDRVVDIIRRHMNDGWIPVEERLPEEGGTYIITAKDGEREIISFAKWQNRYKHFDMTGKRAYWRVIAWRPLPEPYHPEQPETCKYTGGSCCWPIDQCSDCSNHPERGERE